MARTPEEVRAVTRERVRAFRMKARMTPEERAQVEAAEAEVRAEKRRLHLERQRDRVRAYREGKMAEAEAVRNPPPAPLPEPAPHVQRRGRGRPRLTEEQRAARAVSRPAPRSAPPLDVPATPGAPAAPEAPRRSPVTEEEEREAAAQVCAIARFRYFARHLWAVACPDAPNPVWMPHMDVICDEIQEVIEESDRRRLLAARIAEECAGDPELHAELIEAELGNLPMLRVILLVPPRGSKSKLVECLFPAWRWLHRPQDTILALSSSGKLTEKHGVYLRDVLRSPAYLQLQRRQIARGLFRRDPKLKGDYAGGAFGMRGDEDAKGLFSNTLGGGRSGYALGAKYTGADADITIIDDPHDVDDAMQGSAESQERAIGEVVGSYRTKVQDRSNNKLWAPIILITQRVHPNDLARYMIAQPGARVVCLPAEYDPDHEHVYAKDWRTRRGELLDGVRLPRSVLDFMRADDPFAYATKYGMRPTVKEGVRYRREWFDNTFDEDPRVLARSGWYEEVLISVDAANKTGARNDLTSMGVWGRRGLDRDLLDRRSFRAEITGLESEFRQLCAAWPMALIKLVEDKANGTALIQAVKVARYGAGGGMVPPIAGVVPVQPRGDKKTRSAAFAEPVAAERRIRLPARAPWRSEYVENMVGFGAGGQHDDDVDMTSQAMQRWAEIVVPWLDPARRERIARPAAVVTRGELLTRWDRRSSERLASYHMGVVPGWAMGQMRGEAVAVVCDRRGRMVSLVEATEGGVAGFIAAAAVEARYWSAEVVYAEPRDRGSPAMQVAAGLIAAGARVAGRAAQAGEGGRRPGENGAGWGGSRSELSAVWNAFLGLMAEDLVGIPDGATLEAIETVVETEGLPAMADGSPLGGRLLALLLALRGVAETHARVAGSQVVRFEPGRPEAVDLWSLGVR